MPRTRAEWPVLPILVALLIAAAIPARPAGAKSPAAGTTVTGSVAPAGPLDNKIDPALRLVLYRLALPAAGGSAHAQDAPSLAREVNGLYRIEADPSTGEPQVDVFIDAADAAVRADLEALGARVRGEYGHILTARVPLSKIEAVAALGGVRSIELSKLSRALLDSSRVKTKVSIVQAGGGGLGRAYLGDGSVVGILDSGIDFTHPDFRDAQGHTRLKYLYDYGATPDPREWTAADIDGGLCTEKDGSGSIGHGTHVSGIVTGNGRRNPVFIGMAPDADVVFVKGIRDPNSSGGFTDVDVVSGVQYIFDRAATLGEPAAVNLSLGGQFSPHDGTSLALTSLTGPGRIIVAAAGNDGSHYIHGGYTTAAGSGYANAKETLCGALGAPYMVVDIWYPSTATINFGVAVYAEGSSYTAPLLAMPTGVAPGQISTTNFAPYGSVTIDARTTLDPNNHARNVVIEIDGPSGGPLDPNFVWSVYSYGSGAFDMWMVAGGVFAPFIPGLPAYFVPGDNNKSVGSPATARGVVAVGSYVTKTSWVDARGNPETQGGATLGAISTFSSIGPSRDGRTLPVIVAPGEAIVSTLSSGYAPDSANIEVGGGYQKLQGTSMAAPHVTGIVALMLQKNRYLTPDNVMSLLESSAVPAGAPGNTWGWGKVDALAAMLATPPSIGCNGPTPALSMLDCDGVRRESAVDLATWPNPARGAMSLGFELQARAPVHLGIYDLAGRLVKELRAGTEGAGVHQLVWEGTDASGARVPNGIYFARLTTPAMRHVTRFTVLR